MFTKCLCLSIVNSYVEDKLKGSMQFESTACETTVSFTFKINRGLQRRSLTKAKRLKVIAFLLDRKRYNLKPLYVYLSGMVDEEMNQQHNLSFPNFISRIDVIIFRFAYCDYVWLRRKKSYTVVNFVSHLF
jgi:hypothetical protein